MAAHTSASSHPLMPCSMTVAASCPWLHSNRARTPGKSSSTLMSTVRLSSAQRQYHFLMQHLGGICQCRSYVVSGQLGILLNDFLSRHAICKAANDDGYRHPSPFDARITVMNIGVNNDMLLP